MSNRRTFIRRSAVALGGIYLAGLGRPGGLASSAWASAASDQAVTFIKATGQKLVAAINATGTVEDRRKVVGGIIDSVVDVDGVARFCLGRFWRTATPEQQQQYLVLFRQMLAANIAAKLGEYKGVTFTVAGAQDRDSGEVVSTVVTRPNNPAANIQWLVANAATDPKIVDVIAEGTSLRVTQRDDYAAFLSQHGQDVGALIDGVRQQLSQGG
jgi:phospholipid transport system substrate-binding protein